VLLCSTHSHAHNTDETGNVLALPADLTLPFARLVVRRRLRQVRVWRVPAACVHSFVHRRRDSCLATCTGDRRHPRSGYVIKHELRSRTHTHTLTHFVTFTPCSHGTRFRPRHRASCSSARLTLFRRRAMLLSVRVDVCALTHSARVGVCAQTTRACCAWRGA
jgi:hypothetical protein